MQRMAWQGFGKDIQQERKKLLTLSMGGQKQITTRADVKVVLVVNPTVQTGRTSHSPKFDIKHLPHTHTSVATSCRRDPRIG